MKLRAELRPFEVAETAAYIASRITSAGGVPIRTFSKEAVQLIHDFSGGIPRTINVISDNALTTGMALKRRPVDRACVMEVGLDLKLKPNPSIPRPQVKQLPESRDRAVVPPPKPAMAALRERPKVAAWPGGRVGRTVTE